MKKLFVDIDGVLADFDDKWLELYGVHPKDGFNKTDWKDFCLTGQFGFLKLFPGATQLIEYLTEVDSRRGVSVILLGSTGGYDFHSMVCRQKLDWLNKHNIKFNAVLVPGKRFKRFHATPNSMLVDDHPENCAEFIEYGGDSCLYTGFEGSVQPIESFLES